MMTSIGLGMAKTFAEMTTKQIAIEVGKSTLTTAAMYLIAREVGKKVIDKAIEKGTITA